MLRSSVGVIAAVVSLFVMVRAWNLQAGRTTAAATNATNTSAYNATAGALEATAQAGAQLPLVGLVALVAGLLGVALIFT